MSTAPETPPARKPRARRKAPEQASARTIATKRKEAEACRLRERGLNYGQIAEQVGYSNPGAAWKAVERAKAAIPREAVTAMVSTEDARLDLVLQDAWTVRDQAIEAGDGELLLKAGAQMVKVSESRRKLYGVDAPAKTELTGVLAAIVVDPRTLPIVVDEQ